MIHQLHCRAQIQPAAQLAINAWQVEMAEHELKPLNKNARCCRACIDTNWQKRFLSRETCSVLSELLHSLIE